MPNLNLTNLVAEILEEQRRVIYPASLMMVLLYYIESTVKLPNINSIYSRVKYFYGSTRTSIKPGYLNLTR